MRYPTNGNLYVEDALVILTLLLLQFCKLGRIELSQIKYKRSYYLGLTGIRGLKVRYLVCSTTRLP
jgi:hypothetical protein